MISDIPQLTPSSERQKQWSEIKYIYASIAINASKARSKNGSHQPWALLKYNSNYKNCKKIAEILGTWSSDSKFTRCAAWPVGYTEKHKFMIASWRQYRSNSVISLRISWMMSHLRKRIEIKTLYGFRIWSIIAMKIAKPVQLKYVILDPVKYDCRLKWLLL